MAAIETTDRISHMMWRLIDPKHPMYDAELAAKYGDAIEKVYRRADDLVGRLRAEGAEGRRLHGHVRPRLPLLPARGEPQHLAGAERLHGRSRARRARRRTSKTCSAAGSSSRASTGRKTKAYAVGLGQIYFNLRGREATGHRLGGSRVQGPPGRDRARSSCRSRIPRRRARLRATSTGATTSTRASTSRTRPTSRSASTTATASAGRTPWAGSAARSSRTTTGSGAATTAPPPPRSAAASSS